LKAKGNLEVKGTTTEVDETVTGKLTVEGDTTLGDEIADNITPKGTIPDNAYLRFGSDNDRQLVFDGTNFNLKGGDLTFTGITGTPSFSGHNHSAGGMTQVPAAGLGSSVDLEFVRSNDNTVAGDIHAKVDGAYNLGSDANKFDTVYANNFPGAGGAAVTVTSGKQTGIKTLKGKVESDNLTSFAVDLNGQQNLWIKRYSSPAAFETIDEVFGVDTVQFGGGAGAHFIANNANQASGQSFAVFATPDGTQTAGGFSAPQGDPTGLAWDGTYLWHADNTANYIYKLKTDGTQTGDGFASPQGSPWGLTWDGTYIWNTDNSANYIYQLDTSGAQVGGFSSPQGAPSSLAWDGVYLWNVDNTAAYIYKLKIDGTQTGDGFASPAPNPIGITWDGTYLWHGDADANYIYQLKTDGTEVGGFASPMETPRGLAWSGAYLWNADGFCEYIYQLGSATNFDAAYKFIEVG